MSHQGFFRRELVAILHIFVEAAVTEIGKHVSENVTSTGMPCNKVPTDEDLSSSQAETDNDKLRVSYFCQHVFKFLFSMPSNVS